MKYNRTVRISLTLKENSSTGSNLNTQHRPLDLLFVSIVSGADAAGSGQLSVQWRLYVLEIQDMYIASQKKPPDNSESPWRKSSDTENIQYIH